ncbi:VanZ family protein [Bacillus alkalicellulosilyticus]|uniref:VanZ family protein n=1 Tax=Alkalihalobacterium alkalicellulosilyticum TaxID=1912214 RepID=UPI000997EEFB|nr:VanZ family protein [Bacillus alkalicellulosilyticus]
MDKNIELFVKEIVSELECSKEEKSDIAEEVKGHLYLLKNEYLEQGISDEEATKKALESFGESRQLKDDFQKSLSPYYKIVKIGTWTLFCLYAFIVLFNLLFQRILIRINDYIHAISNNYELFNRYFYTPPNSNGFLDIEVWKLNANIIPFRNMYNYIVNHQNFNLNIVIDNTLGNVLIFIPLGVFLAIIFNKLNTMSKVVVCTLMISFSIEFLQFTLRVGQFDIDDIILNTLGSVIGYLIVNAIIKGASFFKIRVNPSST